jgi:hypothetical protein
MKDWSLAVAANVIHDFSTLSEQQKRGIIDYLNRHFPPAVYEKHLACRRNALANSASAREALFGGTQVFPPLKKNSEMTATPSDLNGAAVVLTAGGEGERLRKSLEARGSTPESLADFTKATYPLPNLHKDFGALHANLCFIAHVCRQTAIDIPVVVTTGPAGSITARIIPQIIERHARFGLKYIRIIEQDERLHFTTDEKIAWSIVNGMPRPVTQPDETGGPLMKLKTKSGGDQSTLEWTQSLGCSRIVVLQATGLYEPSVLYSMAAAARTNDCVGAGILRSAFVQNDPFGTYVGVTKNNRTRVCIIEQNIRTMETLSVKDPSGKHFLPYNTGLYALSCTLLQNNNLPDYATPPKEIVPGLPRSPKIGYAATDLFACAQKPAVLSVPSGSFEVIKTVDDLEKLTALAVRCGIADVCRKF